MGEVKGESQERAVVESLSRSGRNWAAIRESLERGRQPIFEQPREITIEMIGGLPGLDESSAAHEKPARAEKER